jgi:hypothetical protein
LAQHDLCPVGYHLTVGHLPVSLRGNDNITLASRWLPVKHFEVIQSLTEIRVIG